MYEVKTIDGQKLINGYSIKVMRGGSHCRVEDGNGNEKFAGTREQCTQWLRDRSMLVLAGDTTVYVVRDASGEYVSGKHPGQRTPASDEALEFDTRDEAQAACDRETDSVLARDAE